MKKLSSFAAALMGAAAVAAAGSPSAAQPVAAATAATADTPGETASGATYVLPGGWSVRKSGTMTLFSPLETDLHLAFVEVKAADGKAAAAAAWELYRPGGARPVLLATALPARNGWDETMLVTYEVSPNEHLAVSSIAFRKGETWTISILDANQATLEKRSAAVSQLVGSLRPGGYARESFAGKTAHPLDPARVAQLVDFVRASATALNVPGGRLRALFGRTDRLRRRRRRARAGQARSDRRPYPLHDRFQHQEHGHFAAR